MQPVEQVFDAIRALTPVERLRLVERVVLSVAEEAAPPATEADTYDDIVEEGGLLVATARAPASPGRLKCGARCAVRVAGTAGVLMVGGHGRPRPSCRHPAADAR
jgi:hypothetical protein